MRYECVDKGCPFVCHLSGNGKSHGVRIKTLRPHEDCGPAFDNSMVDYITIAHYFKKKLQDNPKMKAKEMRANMKRVFNLNTSEAKCKRAKRWSLKY